MKLTRLQQERQQLDIQVQAQANSIGMYSSYQFCCVGLHVCQLFALFQCVDIGVLIFCVMFCR